MEQYSSAQHNLGFYHCVCLSGAYTARTPLNTNLKSVLYAALYRVIIAHPQLTYLIINESTLPEFCIADYVDMDRQVEWIDYEDPTAGLHHQFPKIDNIPPWRLLVHDRGESGFWAAFKYHHSLGDGTAGRVLLESLLSELNKLSLSDLDLRLSPIIDVPAALGVGPSLEQAYPIRIGVLTLLTELARDWGLLPSPKIWSGNRVPRNIDVYSESDVDATNAEFALFSFSSEVVTRLQYRCAELKVSVNAVLCAALVAAIANAIPGRPKLRYSIPRNLRPNIPGSTDKMGVFVCSIEGIARAPRDTEGIWSLANKIRGKIAANIAQGQRNLNAGLLKYIPDMHAFFQRQLGRSRPTSFEFSSLLMERKVPNEKDGDMWTLDDIVFTQSASITRDPLVFSSVGYKGEKLNFACVWRRGFVDGKIPENAVEEFQRIVEKLAYE